MIQNWKRLWALLGKRERTSAAGLLALMVLAAAFEAVGVGLIPAFISLFASPDRLLRYPAVARTAAFLGLQTASQALIAAAGLLVLVFLLKNAYTLFVEYVKARYATGILVHLGDRLFAAYMATPYSIHLRRNSAELIRNTNVTVPRVVQQVFIPALVLGSEILVVVTIFCLLLALEPLIAAGLFVTFAIASIGFYVVVRHRLTRYGARTIEIRSRMIQVVNEGIGGLKEARILGGEPFFLRLYNKLGNADAHLARRGKLLSEMPRAFLEVIGVSAVLIISLVFLIQGRNTSTIMPVLALFGAAAIRLMPSFNRILTSLTLIRHNGPAVEAIHREIHENESAAGRPAIDSQPHSVFAAGDIQVRDLNFRYSEDATPAVHDVSFDIRRGSAIALVGRSGAGKSTIADLILGVLVPTSGSIRVNGIDIQTNVPRWQRHIGYVPQSIFLLDGSIRSNIAFGEDDAAVDEARLRRAVEGAHLTDFVASLPEGLETVVGERGVRLSGGQRQRVGIARALYREPPILVLDEATSAVDNATELQIVAAIDKLRGERTVIVIAHRLSTIRHCDRILMLEEGRIVAEGPYDDLVETSVRFRELAAFASSSDHAAASSNDIPPRAATKLA